MGRKRGRALVVGAGISGIRAALDLAETGYGVTLIDHKAHLGGILSQLDNQFPNNHCGMCKMLPLVDRDHSSQFCLRKGLFHENIDIRSNTKVVAVEGEPGKFSVTLKEKPTWIDPDRCVGCGVCVDVCPVEVPDAFNRDLSMRKAIYLPVPHNIPNSYVIDPLACTNCRACEEICPTDAIELAFAKRRQFRILVVDDELIIRDSLQAWLEEEGFHVTVAASGPEALDKLGQTKFDLMLTDIKMPGMDGVELLKLARENNGDLCVLMMTAYATVETAVEAMQIGARDYLMKPFDPEEMIAKVVQVYEELAAGAETVLEVGAMVFCGGAEYFDPAEGKNVYGYGKLPHVVTGLELERIFSGTGPSGGQLVRPGDGKPIRKIAWLQCVGSRDMQCEADFCSSICCMVAIKEALLAKNKGGDGVETAIFYMDMRTFGKSFQRYRDGAEEEHGVRFERARVHTVVTNAETGDPSLRYAGMDGEVLSEDFDLVVLSLGQRPSGGHKEMAALLDVERNSFGFVETKAFAPVVTGKPGVLVGGSFAGLQDISESVVSASAAALEVSKVIHGAGGSLAMESPQADAPFRDVSREVPRILVALCSCGDRFAAAVDWGQIERRLAADSFVAAVIIQENSCTQMGWEAFVAAAEEMHPNRILLGACHPHLFTAHLKELSRRLHLEPALVEAVDIMSPLFRTLPMDQRDRPETADDGDVSHREATREEMAFPSQPVHQEQRVLATLGVALSKLKFTDMPRLAAVTVQRSALVVGGGIAGMTAALAIADHGYPVDLVEREDELGGNLRWLESTIEGHAVAELLAETAARVAKHPHVTVHPGTSVDGSFGEVGDFYTTIKENDGTLTTIQHGAVILATGGGEAKTVAYGYGAHDAVITQKQLEQRLAGDAPEIESLQAVVMIQCVDSREEPRNYCSRVCCPTALKHALKMKQAKPDLAIYILYRDMMTPGFGEKYYTSARSAGVIFIPYDLANKPRVDLPQATNEPLTVVAMDPLLGRPLEIGADLVVLATGIVPRLPAPLADLFGVERDRDGFFQEADAKWRPVDALKEGVFACGLTLSPRSIPDAIATAGAAAQRALRILCHKRLPAGKNVASVRHSLCSLCERCIETCPYGARNLDAGGDKVLVNPAMCQGCGDCATVCPNSAAVVQGFADKQVLNMIDAALMEM